MVADRAEPTAYKKFARRVIRPHLPEYPLFKWYFGCIAMLAAWTEVRAEVRKSKGLSQSAVSPERTFQKFPADDHPLKVLGEGPRERDNRLSEPLSDGIFDPAIQSDSRSVQVSSTHHFDPHFLCGREKRICNFLSDYLNGH
jgi:hypothetical protein